MSKRLIRKVLDTVPESVVGKVFMNGGSQAIRIPASMRVPTEQVRISFDPVSGIIILEPMDRDALKAAFMAQIRSLTKAERDEIKAMEFKRDNALIRINPAVAEFFKDAE